MKQISTLVFRLLKQTFIVPCSQSIKLLEWFPLLKNEKKNSIGLKIKTNAAEILSLCNSNLNALAGTKYMPNQGKFYLERQHRQLTTVYVKPAVVVNSIF